MGAGAPVPGYSAHDQALTMLKVASDAKGTKDRLEALHKATHKHDEAKREAQEKIHLQDEYARGLDKRTEALDAREESLKAREADFEKHVKDSAAQLEARAASLAEREAVLSKAQAALASQVNDHTHYREREIAAIQKRASDANKLHEAAEADMRQLKADREAFEVRRRALETATAHFIEGLKRV